MLYNPNWSETKTDPFSLGSLIAWLERQPRSIHYEYICGGTCLLAQFFQAHGYSNILVGGFRVLLDDIMCELPAWFNDIAISEPHTFGAALERARKVAAQ
jgi:hypothetical protein